MLDKKIKRKETKMSTTPTNLDPFEGISGAIKASDIPLDGRFKIAIQGRPKTGKSKFAVTIPGSKIVYDFDGRAMSIAGTSDCLVRTLKDTQANPTACTQIETDLSNFKYRKTKGLPIPENYIFDTVSNFIENGIKFAYLKENPKDGRSLTLAGSLRVQIGISFDRINVTTRYLDYLLTEFSQLGNVIFVFHERDEKDKAESKPNDPRYTGLVTVEPQFAANILTFFNEVFRMQVTGSGVANSPAKYEVYCKPTNECTASTTLLIDTVEIPNLADMIAKSKARKIQQVSGVKV
jgi:hypothetical protein